jgi:hypothetical protein
MNPLLKFDRFERPEMTMGSGRYYARLSQTESVPAAVSGGVVGTWLFEAFDAVWFDENPGPEIAAELAEYYERAALFLLELHTEQPLLRVGWLRVLESVEKAAQEDDEIEEWFVFETAPSAGRMLGEGELPLTIYFNLYQPGIEGSVKDIRPADSSAQARLRKVVSTAHIPDASENEVDNGLAGIARAQIDWAVVYDVGQGNAIGLYNAEGPVEAYFDLGGGVNRNAGTFPSALTSFCFSKKPPIILSHWDFDHWSSANRDTQSLRMTWIAPRQPVGPTHLALMTSIMSSGTLLLVPKNLPAKWRGQLYLELCTGTGRNHSGLALTVSAQNNGAGGRMLFPGDARYPCLPSFASTNNYLSVVAPHHGADMRNHTVPTRPSKKLPSRLVYSSGPGNSFKHPRYVTRQDHHCAGWHDPIIASGASRYEVRETANRVPGPLGHVLLGWKSYTSPPSLPCAGICQLRAHQL